MGRVATTHPMNLKKNKRREALKLYYTRKDGRRFTVPGDLVQKHIQTLVDGGFSMQAIARVAGCSDSTLAKIRQGRRDRVTTYVAQGILRVGWVPVPEQAGFKVPSIGTTRRIHALRRMGWTAKEIGAAAGRSEHSTLNLGRGRKLSVEYETWLAYSEAYRVLSVRRGPSAVNAARSKASGWPSPMDWESGNIDDPSSSPKVIEDDGLTRTKRNRLKAKALLSAGVHAAEVASRLGLERRTIERYRQELRKGNDG